MTTKPTTTKKRASAASATVPLPVKKAATSSAKKIQIDKEKRLMIWDYYRQSPKDVPAFLPSWNTPVSKVERAYLLGVLTGSIIVMTIVLFVLI
jgi:capsule polysaccharide export protein KpsC/LpsZ